MQISKEANQILQIIIKQGVKYELEYTFKDCLGKKGVPYRFDFAILDASGALICLIEYDSRLHFIKDDKNYRAYRERDLQKNNYCIAHKIPLYRISFWDLPSIKTYTDLFNPKFFVKSKWHNYDIAREHGLL